MLLQLLVYAVLARRTMRVSFPVHVDSIEASYGRCLRTIGYVAYGPQRVRTRTNHGIGSDARTIHYDALRFDRLRRRYFRCTARLVV